jgi:ketosteroid isomerase-like protein
MSAIRRVRFDPASVVEMTYAFWEEGNLPAMMSCVDRDVRFGVDSCTRASFLRCGTGRSVLHHRLEMFVSDYRVRRFDVTSVTARGEVVDCRATFKYQHKTSGMEIDGRMRNFWHVVDGKIARLDLIAEIMTRRRLLRGWGLLSLAWLAGVVYACLALWPSLPLDLSAHDPATRAALAHAVRLHVARHVALAMSVPLALLVVGWLVVRTTRMRS